MSVIVAPKKKSGFGKVLSGLGMVASFIPGMQAVAPFLSAGGALADGDIMGAGQSVAGQIFGDQGGQTMQENPDAWNQTYQNMKQNGEMNYTPRYDENLLYQQMMMGRQQMPMYGGYMN